MKGLFRWFGILAGLIVAVILCFTLYAHFLVDYSLESLEFALTSTEKKPQDSSQVSTRVYKNLVKDLAMSEAAREGGNLQNLAMLELASRSLDETVDRAGNERARFYLSQTVSSKTPERNSLLHILDQLYRWYRSASYQFLQWTQYLRKHFSSAPQEPLNVSSYLLLSQAEEKERAWKLEEAAELYRKFLSFYPDHPDHSIVSISLAQLLIKQRKYVEAERLLRGIALAGGGLEEYQIATALIKRIDEFRKRESEIMIQQRVVENTVDGPKRDEQRLKLALLYLYSYGIAEAQEILSEIKNSEDSNTRLKAKFYLGWIYKLQSQYDQGARLFLELTQEEGSGDINQSARAQLADIYYEEGDKKSSYEMYAKLSSKETSQTSQQAAREAWAALADAEQAAISFFDMKDTKKAEKHLESLQANFSGYGGFADIRSAMESASSVDLGNLAFAELQNGRVLESLELFKKKIEQDPNDAWAHAGIADVYVLLSDLHMAGEFAEKAYTLKPDEFTGSVLGYVKGYQGLHSESAATYESAIKFAADYVPSKFNLAGIYLHMQEYDKALALLEELDESFTDFNNVMRAKILNNLGIVLWNLGRQDDAVQRFEQALDVTPDLEDARLNLNYAAHQRAGLSSIPASGE